MLSARRCSSDCRGGVGRSYSTIRHTMMPDQGVAVFHSPPGTTIVEMYDVDDCCVEHVTAATVGYGGVFFSVDAKPNYCQPSLTMHCHCTTIGASLSKPPARERASWCNSHMKSIRRCCQSNAILPFVCTTVAPKSLRARLRQLVRLLKSHWKLCRRMWEGRALLLASIATVTSSRILETRWQRGLQALSQRTSLQCWTRSSKALRAGSASVPGIPFLVDGHGQTAAVSLSVFCRALLKSWSDWENGSVIKGQPRCLRCFELSIVPCRVFICVCVCVCVCVSMC